MSYILDALKKSDQERKRNSTPGIHTVHATLEPERGRRRLWPYFLILALALNAGLLLWLFHPWRSEKADPGTKGAIPQKLATATDQKTQERIADGRSATSGDQAKPKTSPRKPKEAASKPSLPAETVKIKPAAEPANSRLLVASNPSKSEKPKSSSNKASIELESEAKRGADPPRTNQARQRPPEKSATADAVNKRRPRIAEANRDSAPKARNTTVPSAGALPEEQAQTPQKTALVKESTETKRKAQMVESEAKLEIGDTLSQEAPSPVRPPTAAGSELQSLLNSDSESEKGVPQLHDLPFAIRQVLPQLSLSMLVYAKNPADRMIGINGQVLREGQDVGSDLKLERITPNGAIFTFRGHRFYKSVL